MSASVYINTDDTTDPKEFQLAMMAHKYAHNKYPDEYENRESGGEKCFNSQFIHAVIEAYKSGFNKVTSAVNLNRREHYAECAICRARFKTIGEWEKHINKAHG